MTIRQEIFASPLEIKATTPETGRFSGFAAVFGNVDQVGDRIEPGAFRETLEELKSSSRRLPMHVNHGIPALGGVRGVGFFDRLEEEGKGLYVEGELIGMNTETGRYRYEQVKSGALGGLSIGFRVRPNGEIRHQIKMADGTRRTLKAVTLREVSLVDDPCNDQARVNEIKHALGLDSIGARMARGDEVTEREIEDELREKLDLSNSLARRLATGGVKMLLARDERRGVADEPEVKAMRDALAGFKLPSFR